MFSPAGPERICKNMLYSIVGIDYHKNRSVSTKNFEDVLISAACKKKQGKLWQKERVLDGTSPLDKIAYRLRFRYSFVGIDYHKNRAVSTKSFENTLISAGCKKRQGKLWQKKRGLDDAYPLDKAIIVKKFRTHLHPGFVPVCRMPLQSERSRAIMPL